MMPICGIYKYENKINGHIYIGQSIDIQKRFREHKNAAFNSNNRDYNLPIHAAIRKYGLDNFNFDIIDICEQSQLDKQECFWIDYYQSYMNGNYNISLGGSNRSHIGRPVQAFDMKGNLIKEYCNAATAAREVGISYSVIQQVLHEKRRSCGGFQWKYSDDPRTITSYKNRQGGKIPIEQYTIDGTFLKEWESAASAGRELNLDPSGIAKCLKGKTFSCGGYYWKYSQDIKEE